MWVPECLAAHKFVLCCAASNFDHLVMAIKQSDTYMLMLHQCNGLSVLLVIWTQWQLSLQFLKTMFA